MRKFGYILATLAVVGLSLVIPASPVLAVDTTIYSSSSDGFTLGYINAAPYATTRNYTNGFVYGASTTATIGQNYDTVNYFLYRSFLYFDTSGIPPDATITAVVLSIYGQTDNSVTNFDITVRDGQPTYPHDPLVTGDYLYTNYSGDGGSLSTAGFSTSAYNDITLNATGRGWINQVAGAKR